MTQQLFQNLIRRVRTGEEDAATEFVRRFEPEIHKGIRLFLINFRLHRTMDISDISQAVLGNFFVRARTGEFQVQDAEQLLKLLLTMARNKVRDEARKNQAQRRDGRRMQEQMTGENLNAIADDDLTPTRIVAGHEFVEEFYRRLTDEERTLARQRAEGETWSSIAAQQGVSAEALRKKLARACTRVSRQLGIPDLAFC